MFGTLNQCFFWTRFPAEPVFTFLEFFLDKFGTNLGIFGPFFDKLVFFGVFFGPFFESPIFEFFLDFGQILKKNTLDHSHHADFRI